jgi:hypothetical protein
VSAGGGVGGGVWPAGGFCGGFVGGGGVWANAGPADSTSAMAPITINLFNALMNNNPFN